MIIDRVVDSEKSRVGKYLERVDVLPKGDPLVKYT